MRAFVNIGYTPVIFNPNTCFVKMPMAKISEKVKVSFFHV